MSKPDWLRTAVFYQVYPQSFYDSTDDGIGDLRGIIAKLDYLQDLGINVVWLNPIWQSPFRDGGYDISDFYKVAPRYGRKSDFQVLLKQAQRRGIRICLDLVAGHTSIDHPWFQQSQKHERNPYSDRYIWSDSWVRSQCDGMMMVRGWAQRNGCFAANFFWSQPALNYGFARPDPDQPWQLPVDHPACQATTRELIKLMRYWLDMGVAGFRVDMAANIIKGDPDKKANMRFWRQIRDLFDRDYSDRVLISEWFNPAEAIRAGFHVDFMSHEAELPLYRAEKGRFIVPHLDGGSYFSSRAQGDINAFLKLFLSQYGKIRRRGYLAITTGNHDQPRLRRGWPKWLLEQFFTFLLTMPVVPFIYYGDEIGMRYIPDLPSKEGGYLRTGSRTPMQWDRTRNAGFSRAQRAALYLPIDPARQYPTVAQQRRQSTSLLNHVRRLIEMRKTCPALAADAGFRVLSAGKAGIPFVYERLRRRQRLLVAFNPSAEAVMTRIHLCSSAKNVEILAGKAEWTSGLGGYHRIALDPKAYALINVLPH